MKSIQCKQHRAETQNKWGHTDAYREHSEKTKQYSADTWAALAEGMDAIFARFAACNADPTSPEAQALVKALQDYITANYYRCTREILAGLGQLYVADDRFRQTIDCHGAGTAAFVSAAIAAYCQK